MSYYVDNCNLEINKIANCILIKRTIKSESVDAVCEDLPTNSM